MSFGLSVSWTDCCKQLVSIYDDMLLDVIQVWLPLCNSAVLVTMIYGVVVKDVDYSMSMGGRYALRRPCQATLGPIRTERAGVEIPA